MSNSTMLARKRPTIDFESYRKPELATRIAAIISAPQSLRYVLSRLMATVLVLVLAIAFMAGTQLSISWAMLSIVYTLITGVFLGLLVGCALLINRSIGNAVRLLELTLEIASQMMADLAAIRSGEARVPSTREIVNGVALRIVLPTIEETAVRSLPVLGRTISWSYRWLLRRCLQIVLRGALPGAVELEQPAVADDLVEPAERAVEQSAQWLSQVQSRITGLGTGFRRLVMMPLIIGVIAAFVLWSVPLVALWILV